MDDCVFCKIVSNDIPSYKVYEDERSLAFLDINPVNIGHTLVIPKEHHADLSDTPPPLLAHLVGVVQKIAPTVAASVNAEGFNLCMNNGQDAGQVIFHAHLHIIPRFPDDGHSLWSGRSIEEEELSKTADAIRKEFLV